MLEQVLNDSRAFRGSHNQCHFPFRPTFSSRRGIADIAQRAILTFNVNGATHGSNNIRIGLRQGWRLGSIRRQLCGFSLKGNKKCYAPTGEADYCTPAAYRPVPDRLFRNEGTRVSQSTLRDEALGARASRPLLGSDSRFLDSYETRGGRDVVGPRIFTGGDQVCCQRPGSSHPTNSSRTVLPLYPSSSRRPIFEV
jgi:hypothetical protein